MKIYELETPCLIVFLNAMETNMAIMNDLLKDSNASLRPHFKTHKCLAIAKKQLALGAKGITCAKLSEAEVLCEGGVADILIANQVVQATKIHRLAVLAGKAKVTVCVDNKKKYPADRRGG